MFDYDLDYQLLDFDDKKKPEEVAKGVCPKCRRHIGKGMHFHIRACDGNAGKAD
jgi:hypothetical protein